MNPIKAERTVLEDIVATYFNVESYDLDALANWVKKTHLPAAEPKIAVFKQQLHEALSQPGAFTPEMFERCTYSDELETQEEIQQWLLEIWNACFA